MIKHCGGLPLAIKVLGGLLAAKHTLHDWKRISENVRSHIMGGANSNEENSSSVYYVLSMGFEELPSYLKYCFLYLAHFPEDYTIMVRRLSYYWAAEGIAKHRYYEGATIRDIADVYIEELVSRNMVIAERDFKSERFEICHLHDMMREICLFKAKEENFLQIGGICSSAKFHYPRTSRRFVSHNPTTLHVERDINNPKLRSLLTVFTSWRREKWMLSGSCFTRLVLLRVLDLRKSKFKDGKLPSSIGKLIHLRYLSLEQAEVCHLPSSLGNLKLLIYLDLDVFAKSIFVPNVLMEMQGLRYLALPSTMRKKTKLELGKLVNLETLMRFSTRECSIGDLLGMAKLMYLGINVTVETSIETVSASIAGLRHLERLTIYNHVSKRIIEGGLVLDFIHLKSLTLGIYMPGILVELCFPSCLTSLLLGECRLEDDPMPILEKFHQLREVGLWHKSFTGRRMVCSEGGFPQLHKLEFSGLEKWEEWKVEEGSMPILHNLTITSCHELKELPESLRFITSLKALNILRMRTEWRERLSQEGEDYYKVQHIPTISIRYPMNA